MTCGAQDMALHLDSMSFNMALVRLEWEVAIAEQPFGSHWITGSQYSMPLHIPRR